jgi:hypothetical protein
MSGRNNNLKPGSRTRAAILAVLSAVTLQAVVSALMLFAAPCYAQVSLVNEFSAELTWKAPTDAEVRKTVVAWLDECKPTDTVRAEVLALWPEPSADEAAKTSDAESLLGRVAKSLALVDPAAKEVVELCAQPSAAAKLPDMPVLNDDKAPAFERNHLRLLLGRWLTQQRLYDDGLAQLKDLQASDVVDPAALLFYQSVCQHWMLHKEDGLKTIGKLLEQKKTIPRRYEQLAELMQADLSALEDESLDHISRRMNDVTRRLDFGHAGKKVRGEEDGIIASLDKLIKQKEDAANAASGGEGGGDESQPGAPGNFGDPQGIRSRSPAADSRLAKGKGPGDVKSKNIGNHSGWGDLPPKDREAAMQQISKDFPSHYRDVIEQYFRRLASEDEDQQK